MFLAIHFTIHLRYFYTGHKIMAQLSDAYGAFVYYSTALNDSVDDIHFNLITKKTSIAMLSLVKGQAK